MKKTIVIQQCDLCEKTLPDNFLDCYVFSINKQEESRHNGDQYTFWKDLLQLCESCGSRAFEQLTKEKEV